MQTMLITMFAGIGVSLAPTCVASFHQPGVTLIPIQPDPPPLEIVAARPKGEPSPAVAAFLEMLRQQLPAIRSKNAYHHST
jgi:DNA-binding transcriptional LysR family regulator